MIIEDKGDTYVVSINHCITIGKSDPFLNFRQYVQDLVNQFDNEMTKTMHQIILQDKR